MAANAGHETSSNKLNLFPHFCITCLVKWFMPWFFFDPHCKQSSKGAVFHQNLWCKRTQHHRNSEIHCKEGNTLLPVNEFLVIEIWSTKLLLQVDCPGSQYLHSCMKYFRDKWHNRHFCDGNSYCIADFDVIIFFLITFRKNLMLWQVP